MIGAWIVGQGNLVLNEIDELINSGIEQMRLMPAYYNEPSKWKEDEILKFLDICFTHDIEPVLSIWPCFYSIPKNQYLLEKLVYPVIEKGFYGLEIELENNALKIDNRVADNLLNNLREIREEFDVWIGGTTHTGHIECTANSRIMKQLDRFNLQVYSVSRRGKRKVGYKSRQGPGKFQRWAIDRVKKAMAHWGEQPKLSIGLPAWAQSWPATLEHTAMEETYRECIGLDICYWSSAHLLRNNYSLSFIKEIAQKSRNRRIEKKPSVEQNVSSVSV